ncbi:MAG: hypothetical protein LBD91_06385 [Prevotellaceae bacterium]|jgi:hypothetical protein|nr:hypothetical protein [Prevotellaceae bacterium]
MPADWIKRNHEALYDQANQTVDYITVVANRTRMGFGADTPLGEWLDDVFLPKHNAFNTALETWLDISTRTHTMTVVLNGAEAAFKPEYRQLYASLKGNPLVKDEDLTRMGLPTRYSGSSHTPVPVPLTVPKLETLTPSPGVIEIHFSDPATQRKGKPHGVHGVEIVWSILDTPPVNWSELLHSAIDTKTPYRFSFEGENRGRRLYFALRWENQVGDKGPWSEIESAIIP